MIEFQNNLFKFLNIQLYLLYIFFAQIIHHLFYDPIQADHLLNSIKKSKFSLIIIIFSVERSIITQIHFGMSSKKILRLKTPTRRQIGNSPKELLKVHPRLVELQTIIKAQRGSNSQNFQTALISEINKLYQQFDIMRMQLKSQKQMKEELSRYKQKLQVEIEDIERELHYYREMYELQRHNHRQLRTFYQKREKEWQIIVMQHKSMLQEYFYKKYKSQNYQPSPEQPIDSKKNILEPKNKTIQSQEQRQIVNNVEKKQIKRLRRKNKQNIIKPEVVYYYAKTPKNHEKDNVLNEQDNRRKMKNHRNPESDDLFEKIMRKTFYHFRQRSFSINQLKFNEDMLKLKHARTSTKQRLIKTLKKLQFQFQNESQIQFFCEYIEQIFVLEHKQLLGFLVYDFLIDKLQNIEALSKGSNSQIDILGPSSLIALNNMLQDGIQNDPQLEKIGRVSRQNLQLLINSVIKPAKIDEKIKCSQKEDEWVEKIRYSQSQLQNLSNIIYGGKHLGDQFFSVDDPPTVDVTMKC